MKDELWRNSAVDLAAAIARKQVSSREVVEAHLARTAEVNPKVNAVTATLAEEALAAADAADRAVAAGAELGVLHGVPFSVKENIDLAGSPTTQGIVAMAEMRRRRTPRTSASSRRSAPSPSPAPTSPTLACAGTRTMPCVGPPATPGTPPSRRAAPAAARAPPSPRA